MAQPSIMAFNLDILGDKQLQKMLNQYAVKDQKKAVNEGLKKANAFMRTETRKAVKAAGNGTRASAKGIKGKKIKAGGRKGFVGWRITSATRTDIAKRDERAGVLRAKGYYPAAQEYGWRTVAGTRIRGKESMKRTFTKNQRRVIKIVREAMRKVIKTKLGAKLTSQQAASFQRSEARRINAGRSS